MLPWILGAMIAVPIIEIGIFIEVGDWIGLWPTISIVVLTAIIGTFLLRQQGLATLFRVQESLAQGAFPMAAVFDGLCLLVAGALLLTPGFFTDALGFLLFVPAFRVILRDTVGRSVMSSGKFQVHGTGAQPNARPSDVSGQPIIDGNFEVIDQIDDPPKPSKWGTPKS